MTKPAMMTKQHFDMVSEHGCVLGWGCQKCDELRAAATLREAAIVRIDAVLSLLEARAAAVSENVRAF